MGATPVAQGLGCDLGAEPFAHGALEIPRFPRGDRWVIVALSTSHKLPGKHLEKSQFARSLTMDLAVWIPVTIVLGLIVLGLMFAFIVACEKV